MEANRSRGGLNQAQAARYVGVSVPTFRERVRPYVRRIDLGRRMVFPVAELDAWLAKRARGETMTAYFDKGE